MESWGLRGREKLGEALHGRGEAGSSAFHFLRSRPRLTTSSPASTSKLKSFSEWGEVVSDFLDEEEPSEAEHGRLRSEKAN